MLPTQPLAPGAVELFTIMISYPKVSFQIEIASLYFWQALFKLNGKKLRMSTSYHPQTNVQNEVLNGALQQHLRVFDTRNLPIGGNSYTGLNGTTIPQSTMLLG